MTDDETPGTSETVRTPTTEVLVGPKSFQDATGPTPTSDAASFAPPPVTVEVPPSSTNDDAGAGEVLVRLAGEIDIHVIAAVRAGAATAIAAHRPVTIDCRDLTFVDSSALVLFALLLRSGQPVTILGARSQLRGLLKITGIDRLLRFIDA